MPEEHAAALTPQQWEARDYRQSARELDQWAAANAAVTGDEDSTEYVAKLGVSRSGCVIAMSRSHDRVLVPPPARAALAGLALLDQPFGFTRADVEALRRADPVTFADLAARIEALLPPAGSSGR